MFLVFGFFQLFFYFIDWKFKDWNIFDMIFENKTVVSCIINCISIDMTVYSDEIVSVCTNINVGKKGNPSYLGFTITITNGTVSFLSKLSSCHFVKFCTIIKNNWFHCRCTGLCKGLSHLLFLYVLLAGYFSLDCFCTHFQSSLHALYCAWRLKQQSLERCVWPFNWSIYCAVKSH